MSLLILAGSLFVFSSCSKTADGNLTKEQKDMQDNNLQASSIDEKDFTESDEDLSAVNYKEFYDQLTPHGEWVQVRPEEIGLKPKTALSNSNSSNFSLSSLFGIRDAYSASVESAEMVYVWKPSTDLVVVKTAGETPVYVPYSNGQWINTDAGWYFKAPTPAEETVSHYGRWVNSPTAGWLWVPGRVWAPAWVDWKQNDEYVSWAPLPPSVYLVNDIMGVPSIDENNYVIVERKHFVDPEVYRYKNLYHDNGNRILISEFTGTNGIVIVNNSIINRGPDVNVIQTIYGRNIELVKIKHVKNFNSVKYLDNEYNVFTPEFKRYKNKNKDNARFNVNEPKSFKKYSEWKEIKSEQKEYKKEDKEYRKEDKEYRKENNGNNNGRKNEGSYDGKKDNGKNNDGKNNGRKDDDKNNGNKQDGNDNGKKHDNNDKGKGKK
jgi:hypothetical protein